MIINVADRNQVLNSFIVVAREAGHTVNEVDLLHTKPLPKGDCFICWDDPQAAKDRANKAHQMFFCMQHGCYNFHNYHVTKKPLTADHYFVYDFLDKQEVNDLGRDATIVGYPHWETEMVKPEEKLPEEFMLYIPRHGGGGTAHALPKDLEAQLLYQAEKIAKLKGLPLVVKVFNKDYLPGNYVPVTSKGVFNKKRLGHMLWLIENAQYVYIPVIQTATFINDLPRDVDITKPCGKAILAKVDELCG